jgi:aspartyl-tRNA(Asn)/glutamyl-tRNA(Gln) amidotransferase subunit A
VDELIALGVTEAGAAIGRREVSATELTTACLDRIRQADGIHSHDGDPDSINAWVRLYEEDALAAAARADELVAAGGDLPPLLGVPIGLKDLYGVAGKPVTASSRLLDDVPSEDCDVWRRLAAAGTILLGHLHTHEFAAGGTTDQVGNPWDLARTAGGSSGGSAAALAARMVPAATGTDTAGSLRIPSACCGTSTIKPTRGSVSTRGVVPLSWSLDHAGPMARSLVDCRALLAAMTGVAADGGGEASTFDGARIAVSPRLASVALDGDVAAGFERAVDACRALGATLIEPPAPDCGFDIADAFHDVMTTDMLAYHRRFDGSRERYRPALRQWLEVGEERAVSGEHYASLLADRQEMTAAWSDWLGEHRISAVLEPTIPVVAPQRGDGYEEAGSDYVLISLTHFWNWTGFPVVALPSGIGQASRLPVSVSLVGAGGSDQHLLDLGIDLQAELGVPDSRDHHVVERRRLARDSHRSRTS